METIKNVMKELKTYNLVKNRKKLLEDRLEQFERRQKSGNDLVPWKKDSLYNMDMTSLLDGIDECEDTITKIDGWLKKLNPMEKLIIEQRFMTGMSWIDIADHAGFCERMVRRIYDKGLEKIAGELGGSNESQ